MMFSSKTFRSVICILSLTLPAIAETIRGVRRELDTQAVVDLGTAAQFTILAKTGITNVPGSAITGNIGVSPITFASMTGFTLILDTSAEFSTSTEVTGNVYAFDYADPTPQNMTDAVLDMEAAYDNAKGRLQYDVDNVDHMDGLIGGETLTPGIYNFTSGVSILSDVTFSGDGVFIIQMTGGLVQAAATQVILAAGADASNIFWQVGGTVTVGATAHMEGILLVKTAATFITGSSLNGRVLAQTFCALQSATITEA
jgi:hypothetical protein